MYEYELNMYWKTVVNTMQEGLMIVDTDGTIVATNRALERITGFSAMEMIGKKCSVLNCNLFESARKDRGDSWCTLFHAGVMDTRRCLLQRKDGQSVDVLKNAALLHDNNGGVIGAVETVTDISELIEKDNQINAFRQTLRLENGFKGMIGVSPPMKKMYDLVSNAALSDAPIIIYGESGTGKELVASALHEIGSRSKNSFVKVNCAALKESLLESELFGHVKGAYTGAHKDREGRFETAHLGDIFLDEIGDISASTQVKLLRVLEEKIVERVGDSNPVPVDVRIISATNRDLEKMAEEGSFRQDLFFRINVIPIHLPPLRERVEDIPLLSENFFKKIRMKSGSRIEGISSDTMDILMSHTWPGNVRELKSVFEYAFVTCGESFIRPHHLPANIVKRVSSIVNRTQATPKNLGNPGNTKNAKNPENILTDKNDRKKQALMEALEQCGGNQSAAARLLGVSRGTIWNRMKKYKITANLKLEA